MVAALDWLNFQHLRYFWTVAREGGVTRAAEALCLSPATVSEQLRQFERAVGENLFVRQGRHLSLTETGRLVYRYAEEIFGLGRELDEVLKTRPLDRPVRLAIGIAKAVPKLIAYQLIEPALTSGTSVHLTCYDDDTPRLLSRLALHELDVVLADTPDSPDARIKAYHHLLGECAVGWFGLPSLVARLTAAFPQALPAMPVLLPTSGSALRRSLDASFARLGITPLVLGEFDDPALIKAFAHAGHGLFAAPVVMAAELQHRYGFLCAGTMPGATERFYAITVDRKLRNPAVAAITQAARERLFLAVDPVTTAGPFTAR